DLFTGGGAGRNSDGVIKTHVFPDGSTVTRGSVDGGKETIRTTIPGVGTLEIAPDDSRVYTLESGKTIYYDKDGNRVFE
ncbi:hypothetical protein, partial [Salmonella sp. SAL4444]|uniref:hypothetical protein n=1 Tax=Salmonella sp. SAL4444 TaxID=3159899 RepID=UPI003979A76A